MRVNFISKLKELEKEREVVKRDLIVSIAFIVAFTIVAELIIWKVVGMSPIWIVPIGVAQYLIYRIHKAVSSDYISNYKKNIVAPLIKSVDESFKYYPNQMIDSELLQIQIFLLFHQMSIVVMIM